jgi:hypothetical protein
LEEQRMSKQIAAALAAPFTGTDLKQRPGRGGMTFTYADARAVAQRLDDVLGLAGWQFEVKVADAQRFVVHGTLVAVIDGVTTVRQDFGYPNSAQDDEPLKSAASDALRRCAAQIGVGRSLYASGTGASLSVAPRPLSVDSVRVSQPSVSTSDVAVAAAMLFAEGECPDHRTAWSFKPAGISKAGKPYNAFHACSGKTNGTFCQRKPSIAWVNAQVRDEGEAMLAAKAKGLHDGNPELETALEDLPF